ncbi:adenylate kinase 8-like [Limulus polyphemus]|uniref:Adenylate kinase 8-like n=1 Tax=Limulus polyphemus TaxID=6850 RepID=A0ABM1C4G0_LIMPO|nr:adenylate kinase 8-like [Limulus polyphemus]
MDALQRPFRILPEFCLYAEKHEIFELFQNLLEKIVIEKPDDPLKFLIKQLEDGIGLEVLKFVSIKPRTNAPYIPRVLLLGPPGAGKQTQASLLNAKYDFVKVDAKEVLKQAKLRKSTVGNACKLILDAEMTIPDSLAAEALSERLKEQDCISKGWVIFGFPNSISQARELTVILKDTSPPNRVVFLNVAMKTCHRRLVHRRFDSIDGTSYHLVDDPPPDDLPRKRLLQHPEETDEALSKRLTSFSKDSKNIQELFEDKLITVDGEQNIRTVLETVENAIFQPIPRKTLVNAANNEL